MPKIEESATALREEPGPGAWQHRVLRPAALVFAGAIWLAACAPTGEVAPAPLASPSAPISVDQSSGPIALAPSMTGPPVRTRAPAPVPELPRTAALPEPPPAPVAVAPPPAPAPVPYAAAPAAAVDTPAVPSPCPPGQIATWSKPDMAGTPVLFCRRLYP